MQESVRLATSNGQEVSVDVETGEVTGEVLEGEIVSIAPERTWDERVQAFIAREGKILEERFANAREVAEIAVVWGEASVEEFAREVGVARSTAYAYRAVWQLFGAEDLSTRPDNIYWRHYELATRAPDPVSAIDEAADEGYTTRQFEEWLHFATIAPESRYTPEGLTEPSVEQREREKADYAASEHPPAEHRTSCPNCSGRGWLVS